MDARGARTEEAVIGDAGRQCRNTDFIGGEAGDAFSVDGEDLGNALFRLVVVWRFCGRKAVLVDAVFIFRRELHLQQHVISIIGHDGLQLFRVFRQ
jgi:hypothetical protein